MLSDTEFGHMFAATELLVTVTHKAITRSSVLIDFLKPIERVCYRNS